MKPDPPIPKGGGCAVCGKPRKPERSRRYVGPQAETDPFCSTTCCRVFHDNPLRAPAPPGPRGPGQSPGGGLWYLGRVA